MAVGTGSLVAGRYLLGPPLGSGGMGTVWLARDRLSGVVVALKVLGSPEPTALQRLVLEQSLRLRHPHLLTAIGWVADDDAAALVLPVARGGSVAALSRRLGPLPTGLVGVLLDQLLAALEVVHGAGIVHRDVKPENLLLDATGRGLPRLRLADFGVAVHPRAPRLTGEAGVIGTEGYMPPAQAAGGRPEPWWDVYAAGVVARELLTGRREGSVRGPLASAVWAMTRPGATAAEARAQVAAAGVPTAASWPTLGMPVLADVVGHAHSWRRWGRPPHRRTRCPVRLLGRLRDTWGSEAEPAGPAGRGLVLLVSLALATSLASLAVSLAVSLTTR